jgi:hypothetical protein
MNINRIFVCDEKDYDINRVRMTLFLDNELLPVNAEIKIKMPGKIIKLYK